jgi:hypothetical protein
MNIEHLWKYLRGQDPRGMKKEEVEKSASRVTGGEEEH